jgi:hypothetical protein
LSELQRLRIEYLHLDLIFGPVLGSADSATVSKGHIALTRQRGFRPSRSREEITAAASGNSRCRAATSKRRDNPTADSYPKRAVQFLAVWHDNMHRPLWKAAPKLDAGHPELLGLIVYREHIGGIGAGAQRQGQGYRNSHINLPGRIEQDCARTAR